LEKVQRPEKNKKKASRAKHKKDKSKGLGLARGQGNKSVKKRNQRREGGQRSEETKGALKVSQKGQNGEFHERRWKKRQDLN